MKIRVDVEATPQELRSFFGMPDIEKVQATVMRAVEKRVLNEVERLSPEALLRNWLSSGPASAVQDTLTSLLHQATEVSKKATRAGRSAGRSSSDGQPSPDI